MRFFIGGCDLYHWRKKYKEGKWQAQVFLHYVDANGPNVEWKYDKRPNLAHHETRTFLTKNLEIVSNGQAAIYHNAFSKETCKRIIESIEKEQGEAAGRSDQRTGGTIDKTVRDVNRVSIPIDRGIGATLTGIAIDINNRYFKYDINCSNQSEFLRYGVGGHYSTHIDTFFELNKIEMMHSVRKLTILLFLNDDFEGGKLFLKTGRKKYYPPQEAGNVLVFPSFFPHSVDPVISGGRVSLVNWLVGPMFK